MKILFWEIPPILLNFYPPAPYNTYFHNSETRPTLFETIRDAQQKGYFILADITETASTNLESLDRLGLITNLIIL